MEGWWGRGGRQRCHGAQLSCVMGDEGQVWGVGAGGVGEKTQRHLCSGHRRNGLPKSSAVGWRNVIICGLWKMMGRALAGCCWDLCHPFPSTLHRAQGEGRKLAWPMFCGLFGCFARCFTHKTVFEARLSTPCLQDAEILNGYRLQVLFHCCPFKTLTVSHSILVQECP